MQHAAILVALLAIPACASGADVFEGPGPDLAPDPLGFVSDGSGGPDDGPERVRPSQAGPDSPEDKTDEQGPTSALCMFDFDEPFECPDACTSVTWEGDQAQVCGDYLCEASTGGPATWICEPGSCIPLVGLRGSDCAYTP